MFKRVDFPAPEGPIIAVSSPDRNLPLTDFKIIFASKNYLIIFNDKKKNCYVIILLIKK